MKGTAVFSPCRTWRYMLTRELYPRGQVILNCTVTFILLNPSTADAETDDPTIRRCIGFAKGWGASKLQVVNLFALRSTDPKALYRFKDPVGPTNDEWIAMAAASSDILVAAWGAHGKHLDRGAAVLRSLGRVHCLGVTKDGQPRHPLYLAATTPLTAIYVRAAA